MSFFVFKDYSSSALITHVEEIPRIVPWLP